MKKNIEILSNFNTDNLYQFLKEDLDMIVVRLGRNYGLYLEDGHHQDFYQFIDAALEMYN